MKYTLIVLAILSFSCRPRSESTSSSETTANAPLSCPNGGTVESFKIGKLDPMPPATVIDFGDGGSWEYTLQPPGDEAFKVRLDVCVDTQTENVEVRRFLIKFYPGQRTEVMTVDDSLSAPVEVSSGEYRIPPSFVSAPGLKEAIFGEPQHLKLVIRFSEGYGHFVRGWMDGNTPFVTAANGYMQDGTMRSGSSELIAGTFEPGDPFKEGPCADSEFSGKAQFALGTAKFKWESCLFQSAGHTTGYRVKKLTVEDTNPALTSEQKQPQVFEKEALDAVLKYKWHHHNACDSFVLTLPHGTYAATSAAMAGCGPILEGAPQREVTDARLTTLYRVQYGTGNPVEGELACEHFHFRCGE